MNRRSLLGFLFAAPMAAKAAVKISLRDTATVQTLVNLPGPTFAPPVPMVLTRPVHPDMLWPGIREWYGRVYEENVILDEEWHDIIGKADDA